jgi:hypothetical protein
MTRDSKFEKTGAAALREIKGADPSRSVLDYCAGLRGVERQHAASTAPFGQQKGIDDAEQAPSFGQGDGRAPEQGVVSDDTRQGQGEEGE